MAVALPSQALSNRDASMQDGVQMNMIACMRLVSLTQVLASWCTSSGLGMLRELG